jgi:HSP20 family molecular chaperone IbpA
MRVFNIFLWKEADCSILYILQPVNGHGELTGTFHLKNNTMLKKLLLAGSLFIVVAAKADDGTKIVSKVQKVIVFLNGAQVTRTASVNISAGTSTLVFENLSPGIDEQSIQVQADGDFTILSVKSELNYLSEELKEKNF